jgi:hypothetical protein
MINHLLGKVMGFGGHGMRGRQQSGERESAQHGGRHFVGSVWSLSDHRSKSYDFLSFLHDRRPAAAPRTSSAAVQQWRT